ncbi:hypothetical protein ASPCADRAFT_130343 [Aspergillus carbonarius ITEM 5010]|uniref:Uncharacterized protein n=1 Tax=Aspergillus carbonarius (strain ITEM 5010) TaxID=602072 RepID=A0A1R3RNH5_ASPC5|nr:hypothetical protein ASPCADRAFT_130343 [Aspergillus carbonarius ITEM 5010]
MISSIVLFFRRDWAGGVGPAVDAPRPRPPVAVVVVVAAVVPAVPVVVEGAPPRGAAREGLSPAVVAVVLAVVLAGCVDGVLSAGLPNSPPVAAAGCAAGAAVAVVAGVVVAVDLAPPSPPNKPPAAAGVDDGVADEVAPPKVGKREFCGVAEEAGVVVDCGVEDGVPRDGKTGLVASAPDVGALKREDVCAPPPAAGAAGAAGVVVDGALGGFPNKVFGVASGCLAFAKRLPPVEGAGFEPKTGFCAAFPPKRPPVEGCCGAVAVLAVAPPNSDGVVAEAVAVVEDGVVDEVVEVAGVVEFRFPKRPPGFCAACPKSVCVWPVAPCGGGPAGVVDEALPNKEPPV